jgi:intermediate cleaving peptidase 55
MSLMRMRFVRSKHVPWLCLTTIQAWDINKIERTLPDILNGASKIYTDLPRSFQHNTAFSRYLSGAPLRAIDGIAKAYKDAGSHDVLQPLRPLMNKIRVKKSEAEITNMRKAGQASGRAFTSAMSQSFDKEKDLGAMLDYHFKLNGCDGPAYVPVIAGGEVSRHLSLPATTSDNVERTEHTLRPK